MGLVLRESADKDIDILLGILDVNVDVEQSCSFGVVCIIEADCACPQARRECDASECNMGVRVSVTGVPKRA